MSDELEVRVFRASRPSWRTPVQLLLLAFMAYAGATMLNAKPWGLICATPFLVMGASRVWRMKFQSRDRIEVDSVAIREYVWNRETEILWDDVAAFGWLEGNDEIYPVIRSKDGREFYLWTDDGFDELRSVIEERTGLSFVRADSVPAE